MAVLDLNQAFSSGGLSGGFNNILDYNKYLSSYGQSAPINSAPPTNYNNNVQQAPSNSGGNSGGGGNNYAAQYYASGGKGDVPVGYHGPSIPQPQQPQIDFDALIRPAIEGLDAAIGPLTDSTNANIAGINTNRQQQIDTTNQSIGAQTKTISNAQTDQSQYEKSATDSARRQYAEIQQGLQSRYGGTTGTGAFATEYAGGQSLRSLADIKTNAANAQRDLSDKMQQVQEVGRTALAHIESDTTDQIAKAKANLELQLADIRNQKGQLMAHKAELAANAVQMYQQQVNQVNMANGQFKQQLYAQQQAAQQNLELALAKATSVAQDAVPNTNLSTGVNYNYGTSGQNTNQGGGTTTTKKDNTLLNPWG